MRKDVREQVEFDIALKNQIASLEQLFKQARSDGLQPALPTVQIYEVGVRWRIKILNCVETGFEELLVLDMAGNSHADLETSFLCLLLKWSILIQRITASDDAYADYCCRR